MTSRLCVTTTATIDDVDSNQAADVHDQIVAVRGEHCIYSGKTTGPFTITFEAIFNDPDVNTLQRYTRKLRDDLVNTVGATYPNISFDGGHIRVLRGS